MKKSRRTSVSLLVAIALSGCVGGADRREPSTIVGNMAIEPIVMRAPTDSASDELSAIGLPDEARNESLVGVHVRINGLDTETDANGVFVLGDIAPGTVTLVFATDDLSFSMVLNVPAGSTVFLHDIILERIDHTARPRRVEIKGKLQREDRGDGAHLPLRPSVSI